MNEQNGEQFYEVTIQPASGGFGEFQCLPINGEGWADEADLVSACYQGASGEVFELGWDELPDGVEDVRGRIHGEPARVFAVLREDGSVGYFGITKC